MCVSNIFRSSNDKPRIAIFTVTNAEKFKEELCLHENVQNHGEIIHFVDDQTAVVPVEISDDYWFGTNITN